MTFHSLRIAALAVCGTSLVLLAGQAAAAPKPDSPGAEHARIVAYWTKERVAAAIPRDLRIDERGYGYLRQPNGSLEPYGHTIAALSKPVAQQPMAKPGDTAGPAVTGRDPANLATIGTTYTFKATVTDKSAISSVLFRITAPGGTQQSFTATAGAGGVYSVPVSGLASGTGTWSVVAKDSLNNTTTTTSSTFTVGTGGGGGGGGVVANAQYTGGGAIQDAVGRIYFEMPSNSRLTRWAGYVCSGTVVTDATSGRSIVQTAGHCVYDDVYKAFARNVLFIPNQAGTSGTGTDLNCSNDPLGCWTPSFGVVDVNWTTGTFPNNIPWDYAYYVFNDSGSHSGAGTSTVLDTSVTPIPISFGVPFFDVANSSSDYTTALGYSYSEDPKFMYCAEDMQQYDQANWWQNNCGLSGGSSGGPWMQPFSGGTGSLISVNSWGYTGKPGMAGPKLSGNSAKCVFALAKNTVFTDVSMTDGKEGTTFSGNCP